MRAREDIAPWMVGTFFAAMAATVHPPAGLAAIVGAAVTVALAVWNAAARGEGSGQGRRPRPRGRAVE